MRDPDSTPKPPSCLSRLARPCSFPENPAQQHQHAEKELNHEPPGIPPRGGIFPRELSDATRAAFGVHVDRLATVRAGDRLVVDRAGLGLGLVLVGVLVSFKVGLIVPIAARQAESSRPESPLRSLWA
jgi:hypothetical protein